MGEQGKGVRGMEDKKKEDKKKEDPITKLEKEFSAFQVEWKRFLTNDLPHLTADVGSLKKDVATSIGHIGSLKKDVATSIGHIVSLVGDQKATGKSIRVMDQNIIELLKRTK